MPRSRYALRDPELLRHLMASDRFGGPYTVRSLGEETRLSKSKISGLLSGRRPSVDESAADRIAERLGMCRDCIFQPLGPRPRTLTHR